MGKWLEMESIRFYVEDDRGTIEGVFADGIRQKVTYPSTLDRTTGIDDSIEISRRLKVPLMIIDKDKARKAVIARTTQHEASDCVGLSVGQETAIFLSEFIDPFK